MDSWERLHPTVVPLIDRSLDHGLSTLSDQEQVLLLVWGYSVAIDDGGHASFFYNSFGEHSLETTQALRQMGSLDFASILDRAIDQFPLRNVPVDIDDRNALLEELPESADLAMRACDDDYYAVGSEELLDRLLAWFESLRS